MAAPVSFVGRGGELSRLLAALGRGVRLVLVVGDAGVGKSRFAGEGMARAAAAGMVMVRGECLPLAETVPLLPLGAALGELARLDNGRVMRAALDAATAYVGEEVGRLTPGLAADGGPGAAASWAEGWRRGRLFSAVGELLNAAGSSYAQDSQPGIGLVIEDVHWADGATLDFLTFLVRGGHRAAVCVVATCRGDEAPAGQVARWLAEVRAAAGVEEIRLGPLSREEAAGQVAALAGGPVAAGVADELYARAEGNPFFTEQLVAAALAGAGEGALRVPAGLPARLAELLTARSGRCTGAARAVLAGLAVAGRPLAEDLLAAVTGLDADAVREGLRELAADRLLADDTAGGAHRPRHALLAEAVAGGLLPGERVVLHERTAREPSRQRRRRCWPQRWPGTGRRSRRAGIRLRGSGGALAAGHRTLPGAARRRGRRGHRCAGSVPAGHRRPGVVRHGGTRRGGRRGGAAPLRRRSRPGHRGGCPAPRRGLPGG